MGINDQDKIPAPGGFRDPKNHNNPSYSANFELRVWMADTGKWETVPLQSIHEGEMLSGKVKDYDFTKDFGYKLFEINKLASVDSRFNPGQKEVVPVVRLENQKTKAIEEVCTFSPKRRSAKNRSMSSIKSSRRKTRKWTKSAKAPPPPAIAPTAPAPAAPAAPHP